MGARVSRALSLNDRLGRPEAEFFVSRRLWTVVVGLLVAPATAGAQPTDYSAGKSPPQLFASDCSACHASSRGLSKGKPANVLARFLREHYTTKQETAAALAGFLASAGNAGPEPRSARQPQQGRGAQRPTGVPPTPPPEAAEPSDDPVRRPPRGIANAPAEPAPARETPAQQRRQGARAVPPPPAPQRAPEPMIEQPAPRAAEEAAQRSKIRAYATSGEEARPLAAEQTAPAAQPPQATGSAPAAGPSISISPSPGDEGQSSGNPPAGERPASPPS
jgi:hypothetical protein